MGFQVIPALELRAGCVVHARRGTRLREAAWPDSAVELALRFAAAGASWLHVVDLDGVHADCSRNLAVLEAIAATGALAAGGWRGADHG